MCNIRPTFPFPEIIRVISISIHERIIIMDNNVSQNCKENVYTEINNNIIKAVL